MTTDQSISHLIRKMIIVPHTAALLALLPNLGREEICRVAFVNAHAINLCYRNPEFLKDLMDCDFIFRDGSGMNLLFKMIGRDPGLNLNGTDLIPRLFALYKHKPVALLGTSSPYLEKAAETIAAAGPRPVILLNGFQEDDRYSEAAGKAPVSLIILAMGMPKQERIARHLAAALDAPCLIVCGGAILDFLGGKVTRAPEIFRRAGIEWVYRLMQEPKRLFGRYVIGNAVFILRALRLAYISRPFRETKDIAKGGQFN